METARFVFYRFLQSLFALLCIITLTFFLARLAPMKRRFQNTCSSR